MSDGMELTPREMDQIEDALAGPTLTEFLTARLDEDEARARSPHLRTVYVGQTRADVREKAEVDAKRQVLDLLTDDNYGRAVPISDGARQVLAAHASVYADHPDYDEAWRP